MLQSLSKILPPSGVKQWWATNYLGGIQRGSCSTLPQLVTKLIELDAAGWDVFFACSGFTNGLNRDAENACAMKSFWADIDAGPGKPYVDADAAFSALEDFCYAAEMSFPFVIQSGYGLHVYWIQPTEITPEQWLPKAKVLKALLVRHGLHADPSRTADRASILRPPGTKNRKPAKEGEPPRPITDVFVRDEGDEPTEFMPIIPNIGIISNFSSGISTGSARPSMTEGIVDGQGRTNGMMTRAGWLTGPDGLGFDAAIIQLRAWNTFNKPPLDDQKLVDAVTRLVAKEQENRKAETKKTFGTETPIWLPPGFRWGRGQCLQYEKPDPNSTTDGATIWATISEAPVYIERMLTNETNGKETTKIVSLHPSEGWKEILIPNYELAGVSWKQALSAHGITINTHAIRGWTSYVEAMQPIIRKSVMNSKQYDQFGPREDFTQCLWGDRLYKSDGTVEKVSLTPRLQPRASFLKVAKGADLEAWKGGANQLYAPGCEAQGITLLCGIGSILIHLICGNDGGAFLSLCSRGTGKGKSTAMDAAASVWGHLRGSKLGTVDTNNSASRQMEILGFFSLMQDEKDNGEKDARFRIKEKMAFTDGQGRARMTSRGEDADMPKEWRMIMIESSNKSFIELALSVDNEPMAARVFELAIGLPDHLTDKSDKALQKLLDKHHGIAGEAFLKFILIPKNMAFIKKNLPVLHKKYQDELRLGQEGRFIYYILAVVHMTAILVNSANILNFDIPTVMSYALAQVKDRDRNKKERTEKPQSQLAGIMSRNLGDSLGVDRPWVKGKVNTVLRHPSRNGVHMRMEKESKITYMSASSFRKYCKIDSLDANHILKECRKLGIISPELKLVTLGAGTGEQYDTGQTSCIVIDMAHPALTGGLALVDDLQSVKEEKAKEPKVGFQL